MKPPLHNVARSKYAHLTSTEYKLRFPASDDHPAFSALDCSKIGEAPGISCEFVQDNQSSSTRGLLRGMHFQIRHPQAKLVRVISGEVFDVCVDLRPGSPTYGKWEGAVLSAENRRQQFIPRGFAHGFLVLSDTAEFCYKFDDVYHPGDEGGLMRNDPAIGIEWPPFTSEGTFDLERLVLSEKDRAHPPLAGV